MSSSYHTAPSQLQAVEMRVRRITRPLGTGAEGFAERRVLHRATGAIDGTRTRLPVVAGGAEGAAGARIGTAGPGVVVAQDTARRGHLHGGDEATVAAREI